MKILSLKIVSLLALLFMVSGCSTYQPQPNAAHLVPSYANMPISGTANTGHVPDGTLSYIKYQIRMKAAGLR
jgi:uncharacterized lipoprotein YajG